MVAVAKEEKTINQLIKPPIPIRSPPAASALSGKAIMPAGHIRQNIYMPGLFLTRPNLFSVTWPTIHPCA